jgi:hypothetical protein
MPEDDFAIRFSDWRGGWKEGPNKMRLYRPFDTASFVYS